MHSPRLKCDKSVAYRNPSGYLPTAKPVECLAALQHGICNIMSQDYVSKLIRRAVEANTSIEGTGANSPNYARALAKYFSNPKYVDIGTCFRRVVALLTFFAKHI